MVSQDNAVVCDGPHKNAVLLLKPLELLEAALDRLQGYYLLGISHLFDLFIIRGPCSDTALELFSSIGRS
jgi:hypothetical protein